jgi:transposase InsO family protein
MVSPDVVLRCSLLWPAAPRLASRAAHPLAFRCLLRYAAALSTLEAANRPQHAERAHESLGFVRGAPDAAAMLLRDHDTKLQGYFDAVLRENGVRVQKVGPRSPNLNAITERWVQTVQHECLDHFVVFGESHLRYLLDEFLAHYHVERPHQSLGNRPLTGADPPPVVVLTSGEVECQERLGGLLKHYRRRAA